MRTPNGRSGTGIDMERVRACQRGEREAFRSLFERYRDPVYRLAYRFTAHPQEAEDAAQEIFVRVFERLPSFRGDSSFSTWLYRLAVRHCLNRARRDRKERPLDDLTEEPSGGADPADLALRSEREGRALNAVADLPENLRAAFVLVAMEGMPYAEAAEVLELSVEAVRMRMSRARKELKERLTGEGMVP